MAPSNNKLRDNDKSASTPVDRAPLWDSIVGLFGGEHAKKNRLKKYKQELAQCRKKYEEHIRLNPTDPYAPFGPRATATRFITNPTIVRQDRINNDSCLEFEQRRLRREADAKKDQNAYEDHNIWTSIPLPASTRKSHSSSAVSLAKPDGSHRSSEKSCTSLKSASRHSPPGIHDEDSDNEFVDIPAPRASSSLERKDAQPSWCGRKGEPTPDYTVQELHLKRQEAWNKRAQQMNEDTKDKEQQQHDFKIKDEHFLYSDGHCGSPAEIVQRGFHPVSESLPSTVSLGSSPSSVSSSSPSSAFFSTPIDMPSSQTSANDLGNSVCSEASNASSEMPSFMYKNIILDEKNLWKNDKHDDFPPGLSDEEQYNWLQQKHRSWITEPESMRSTCLSSPPVYKSRQCKPLKFPPSLDQPVGIIDEACAETRSVVKRDSKRVSFASAKPVSYFSANRPSSPRPPSFVARCVLDISKGSYPALSHATALSSEADYGFAKLAPSTSRKASVSLLSESLKPDKCHAPRINVSPSDEQDVRTYALAERRLSQAKLRTSQVELQRSDNCDEGIASESEEDSDSDSDDSDAAFDSMDWGQPLTPENGSPHPQAEQVDPIDSAPAQSDDTLVSPSQPQPAPTEGPYPKLRLPSSSIRPGEIGYAVRNKQDTIHEQQDRMAAQAERRAYDTARLAELHRRGPIQDRRCAEKAAKQAAGQAAYESYQQLRSLKKHEAAMKAEREKGQGKKTNRPVALDSPCTAYLREMLAREAQPFNRKLDLPEMSKEARLEVLAKRATTPNYPHVKPPPDGTRAHYTNEELEEERSRGTRWDWDFVYPEHDEWIRDGFLLDPITCGNVLKGDPKF